MIRSKLLSGQPGEAQLLKEDEQNPMVPKAVCHENIFLYGYPYSGLKVVDEI